MIWYRVKPQYNTLRALFLREPRMRQQVGHAAVACNYQILYDVIKPVPTESLLSEALVSHNRHYLKDLKARKKEMPPEQPRCPDFDPDDGNCNLVVDKEPTTTTLEPDLRPSQFCGWFPAGIYSGTKADATNVDLFKCSPPDLAARAEKWDKPYELHAKGAKYWEK